MKVFLPVVGVLVLCSCLVGQTATPASNGQTETTSGQSKMPEGMDSTLTKYVSACERRSMSDLLAVWPDLQKDKKEYGKIKKHFEDGNVSNVHVSLQPLETQKMNDDAIVQAEQTEKFVKAESVESGGDNMMGRYPAQNSGPHQATKDVKKTEKVWMKLHKQNDEWMIVQVSEKPLSF